MNLLKRTAAFSLILSLFALLPACKNEGGYSEATPEYDRSYANASYMSEEAAPKSVEAPAPAPKIIYTASMRCRVRNLDEYAKVIQKQVERMNGRITDMNWTRHSSEIENRMTIRVPAQLLDSLMNAIAQNAEHVHYRNLQSQDVTEEFVDIETRLRTKKEVRDRYLDLLRNKAKTLSEVLDAEEKIRVLQEEIEAQEGRLKFLNDQVAMSTLNLELYQPTTFQREPEAVSYPFGARLLDNLKQGFRLLQSLVLGAIYLWPVWILVAAGVIFWRRRRNLRKKSSV